MPRPAGGHEERVHAGDLAPGRVYPLFHLAVEYIGDVGFPGVEVLGRWWRCHFAHGREGCAMVGTGLADVDAMTEISLIEDPGQPPRFS